jgi:quercetin dioxygenase-like cupin family protein
MGLAAMEGQSGEYLFRRVAMTVDTLIKPTPISQAEAIATAFSHIGEGETEWRSDGLRDFFLYRDLGVAAATSGQVIAQLVKANLAPEEGTGWHRHEAKFHIVLMLKGWARFMYEDKETLVKAGDCVHQRPGIVHYLFDYSPDMEYLEVVSPADFTTIDIVEGPCAIPPPMPWK